MPISNPRGGGQTSTQSFTSKRHSALVVADGVTNFVAPGDTVGTSGGIAFGQFREGFERGSGRDREMALDFAAESVEIGFEDFWFLGRR